MSDKPIEVGALVMIVRTRNPLLREHLGKVGKVLRPCNIYPDSWDVEGAERIKNGELCSWTPYTLKRLDPPETGDSLPTRRDLKEPA